MKFLAKPENRKHPRPGAIMFVDAAFTVRHDHGSQGGYIILAGGAQVLQVARRRCQLCRGTHKLNRSLQISLAECQAHSAGLEELLLVKNYLPQLQFTQLSLKEVQQKASGQSVAITDSKSLLDGIKRETIRQSPNKRVALECLVIQELLENMKCQWTWISSERQLADELTKLIRISQNVFEDITHNWCQMKVSQQPQLCW